MSFGGIIIYSMLIMLEVQASQLLNQGWQVLPIPGFNHGFNSGFNRVGQNSKNPLTVGKTGQNVIKF
jgi:hypothetical protein